MGGVVIEHKSHIRLPWSKVSLLHLFTAAQVNYKAPTLPPSRPAALETLMGVGGLHHHSRHQPPGPPAVSQHLSFTQLLASVFIQPSAALALRSSACRSKLCHAEMLNSGDVFVIWVHGDNGVAMG